MLVIRLQRTGKRNDSSFRIVLAEKDAPVKGRYKELLGYYLPNRDPIVLECDQERVDHWVQSGAQVSDTVARILTKAGSKTLGAFITPYTKKKKKNAPEEEAPAAPSQAETPKEEKVEAPVADTPPQEEAKQPPEEPVAAEEKGEEKKEE
ncbi:MAG: 30S ribosomal protein S16 [Candidatus Peribacteraceae bacterium]